VKPSTLESMVGGVRLVLSAGAVTLSLPDLYFRSLASFDSASPIRWMSSHAAAFSLLIWLRARVNGCGILRFLSSRAEN
jgi:hypothetical protein